MNIGTSNSYGKYRGPDSFSSFVYEMLWGQAEKFYAS